MLLFDGDCGFCTRSAALLERLDVHTDVIAWQLADIASWGITPDQAAAAVQFVRSDGRVTSGARAIADVLATGGLPLRMIARTMRLPVVRTVADRVYRTVSRYRYRLPGGTPACRIAATAQAGAPPRPAPETKRATSAAPPA